jgi:indolepyruvate ferredoxin oxidoreductase alpha subunit
MNDQTRQLLSGNEAVALGALHAGVTLGVGYPGTPSTEILENLSTLGGEAEWAPNEKVALEVGIGVAFGRGRALVTMKHVGVNVAADPLFTAAYTGIDGALVLISADDPGMASSQNEQDNRRYAEAAGIPMLEPSDSQEAYDFTRLAMELSHEHQIVVMLRLTTRICHSRTVVAPRPPTDAPATPGFERDVHKRVMVPAFARDAHRKMRQKLANLAKLSENSALNPVVSVDTKLGIIANGITAMHVQDAAPDASLLKIGFSYPLPMEKIRAFADSVKRCVVIEEGDPWMATAIRAAGIQVEDKPEMYRFGELNVNRVRRILDRDTSPEPTPPKGRPPQLCQGCPHRITFEMLRDKNCIVTGDIGCYTLGVLPPFNAMDTCVCMGASIGVGLGLRHTLPEDQARRVVSVIGDSTFVHSGITGLVEMAYNRPKTGHLVIVLDNNTTAMTGLQEHPGTGRKLNYDPAPFQLDYEPLGKSVGMDHVQIIDPLKAKEQLDSAIDNALNSDKLTLLVVKRPCILALKKAKKFIAS